MRRDSFWAIALLAPILYFSLSPHLMLYVGAVCSPLCSSSCQRSTLLPEVWICAGLLLQLIEHSGPVVRICAFTAKGASLIPGGLTSLETQPKIKKKKKGMHRSTDTSHHLAYDCRIYLFPPYCISVSTMSLRWAAEEERPLEPLQLSPGISILDHPISHTSHL